MTKQTGKASDRGRRLTRTFAATLLATTFFTGRPAFADMETEEKFETVFVTAGYSTALGAGIGLALLAFTPDPGDRMQRYIATGAATGFLSGAALGGYLVLRPDTKPPEEKLDPHKKALGPGPSRAGLRLDWTIARF
ncbi:MAG: hypothetical protein RIQ81_811 [Pseudomonadota bacterium]|jgi:hypothetical protein